MNGMRVRLWVVVHLRAAGLTEHLQREHAANKIETRTEEIISRRIIMSDFQWGTRGADRSQMLTDY